MVEEITAGSGKITLLETAVPLIRHFQEYRNSAIGFETFPPVIFQQNWIKTAVIKIYIYF